MKLSRRRLLLAGLTTGVLATGTPTYLKERSQKERQKKLEEVAKQWLNDPATKEKLKQEAKAKVDQWFGTDEKHLAQNLSIVPEPAKLTPPQVAYNRAISKLLIQVCRVSTEQYALGKEYPDYDGDITLLPTAAKGLGDFKQVASIRGLEDDTRKQKVEIPINPLTGEPDSTEQNLQEAQNELDKTIKQVVKVPQKIPVYYGFVLTSKVSNVVVFRGTTRIPEWVRNLLVFQSDYERRGYGRVHSGFSGIYDTFAQQLREIVSKLNPAMPLYITGHSLGGALATLAAIDLVLNLPEFKNKIQLYTYACPRVGDPAFATKHSQLIPNSYRVVNLADLFNMVPPIETPAQQLSLLKLEAQKFSHVGQEWAFLANRNDMDLNHRIDTYRSAILRELETNKPRRFPISGLS